jgi:hypothetical protein
MEYDLIRLFDDHPQMCLFEHIPSAIVTFEQPGAAGREVGIEWRKSAGAPAEAATLTLTWDLDVIRARLPLIDRQLRTRRERDDDRATQVMEAAYVVAVAVMAHFKPDIRFTFRSDTGTGHDFYLNDTDDEMIEIAGRWDESLTRLFNKKRTQSDKNSGLRKRWVSVTTVLGGPMNRTEGLHT